MTTPHDADVVVVGAGPVGLTLALFLARQGVGVRVLEKEARPSESPRAMVYLHSLLGDLDEVGMLAPMREVAWLDREGLNLHVPALGEVISIPNTALDGVDAHPYNLHLGQGEYCRIALDLLSRIPRAEVVFDVEVVDVRNDDDDGVVVSLADGEAVTARYAVGADGGHSVVRRSMGATLDGFTWGERFVATNVRYDFRAHGFMSSNMYAHDEIGCIVAQITPDGLWRCTYQESLDLPEETAGERIAAHFERLLGREDAAGVRVEAFRPYRMHQRLASTLRAGKIVLAGDAAHLTNPTGGLGLTTGLYDVFHLQRALRDILQSGADEDDVLEYYARERSRVFDEVTSPNATRLKRLVYDTADPAVLDAAVQPLREVAGDLASQRRFLEGLDEVRSRPAAAR